MTEKNRFKLKLLAIVVLAVLALLIANPKPTGIGWLDGLTQKLKINLGLDLQGGVHLVYEADMSKIERGGEADALDGIQDVIERRVNAYGVAEPLVQTSKTAGQYRLIVELAGVKDIEEAKKMIKETPYLDFREEGEPAQLTQEQKNEIEKINQDALKKAEEVLAKALAGEDFAQLAKDNSDDGSSESGGEIDFFKKGAMVPEFEEVSFKDDFQNGQVYPELVKTQYGYHIIKKLDQKGEGDEREVKVAHILISTIDLRQVEASLQPEFKPTGLSGQHLKRAQLTFNPQTNQPEVSIEFNDEGKELFKQITERNLQKPVAIYLDNKVISAPIVQDVIRDGQAVINGKFSLDEAKELAQRLNAGALPVPIKLINQQSIEASLGQESLQKSLKAGLVGLIAVGVFMVLYYRLAGLVAVLALAIYTALMVSIFKVSSITPLSITLTLSGIAGFVLSIGMAVDANVLIFERMKEELRNGRDMKAALREGFKRAWTSIRDGNYSTILTALILTIFGTGFIKGFAITLIVGVLVSMFTAIVITRMIFNLVLVSWFNDHKALVLGGISKKNKEN